MADSTELKLSTPSAKIEGEFKRPSGFPRLRPAYILKVIISCYLDCGEEADNAFWDEIVQAPCSETYW